MIIINIMHDISMMRLCFRKKIYMKRNVVLMKHKTIC